MKDLNKRVMSAASDSEELTSLIEEYQNFIIATASKASRRYITKSDDEWSISLSAFSQAVKAYSLEKGNFLSFAELVIRRRLIDYNRQQKNNINETLIDPAILSDNNNIESPGIQNQIISKVSSSQDNSLKYEIEAANSVFAKYGFSFFDLTTCSPKAKKTRTACAKVVAYIIKTPIILEQLRSSKILPIKTIQNNSGIPRKIIERHRKYIIAAVEVLTGNYPYLAEYLRFIREEL